MQASEIDAALEARGKGFDYTGAEERLGTVGENGEKDGEHEAREKQGRDYLSGAGAKEAVRGGAHGWLRLAKT
ncbi:MAG: hypothetical protein WAU58_05475 [Terriglobales bacterium]